MIIDHDRYMDEIGAYLLGALTEEETRVFERHVESCDQCRRELERLHGAADALPRAVEPVEPPARLKRELMRQIRRDAGAARPSLAERLGRAGALRPRLAWAAASLVLLAAVGIGLAVGSGGGTRTVAAQVSIRGAHAELVIPSGGGATLRMSGFPAPPRGDIYELWLERDGRVVPASLFSVRGGGGAAAVAQSLKGVTAVMVTREVAAGVDSPTRAPIVIART